MIFYRGFITSVLILVLISLNLQINAQNSIRDNAYASPDKIFNLGPFNLAKDYSKINYYEDFNDGNLPNGWDTVNANIVVNDTCDPGPHSLYLWVLGSNQPFGMERIILSDNYSTLDTGYICFDLKFGIQSYPPPCEGPDMLNEGVSIQFSENGGIDWNDIAYFCTDGNIYSENNFGHDTTGASGYSVFTNWSNYCFNVPSTSAGSGNIRFRWLQEDFSIHSYDSWGIDEFAYIRGLYTSNVSEEKPNSDNISIYPNPNSGKFELNVNLDKIYDIKCEIYDSRGKKVYSLSQKKSAELQESVNIEDLSSGVYNLIIQTDDEYFTKRFVLR